MSNLSQSVKGKIIFWRLDPLWSPGCPNPRVESNDAKLIFIFVLFNKYYCVLSKNFVTYSTATQIYISTTSKTAMTTSGKISKYPFQNTHAGFTIFSVHSQHLKSSPSAFRPALSNLWLLLVYYIKQIDSMLPCVCSVIDHRGRQNVVRTSVTHSAAPRVQLFCSYHILTSSVIYYWTDARQHGIYLLNIYQSVPILSSKWYGYACLGMVLINNCACAFLKH